MSANASCSHEILQLEVSSFAELAGFERPNTKERLAAALKSNRGPPRAKETESQCQAFPAPLVLPHDDLNYDPEYPGQPFREWLNEPARNIITQKRKTLYVAAVPQVSRELEFLEAWTKPIIDPSQAKSRDLEFQDSDTEQIIEYLQAFYHGLEVKPFPTRLRWTAWEEPRKSAAKRPRREHSKYVALQYGKSMTRVRTRDSTSNTPVFTAQLNLNDILDAAIAMLPEDAYSLLLLVNHDIFESKDDDFCCGRAYGGSRIAVVQTARYNPLLDAQDGIKVDHTWPMSHCKAYVDDLCLAEDVEPVAASAATKKMSKSGPIRAAINAASQVPLPETVEDMRKLWTTRVARTASHELGHCMGMDHCVYYACNMQGTAGMQEDVRQPPSLCPICLTKLSYAIACELGEGSEEDKVAYQRTRYETLRDFCAAESRVGVAMWTGLGAWVEEVLESKV